MRTGTRPAHMPRSLGRRFGLVASLVVWAFFSVGVPAIAQEDGNQAGLLVQFGDGSLYTACVDLGPGGQATGEEVLRVSGLTAVVDYGSGFGGGTVCKIEDVGCDFPAEQCFCSCTMKPGDTCIYWSYFHLVDGQWRYSPQGASRHVVKPGDVEGWAWGLGSSGSAVAPPALPFEQICPPASAEPAPPQTLATSTPTVEPLRPSATGAAALTPSPSPSAAPILEVTSPATQRPTPTSTLTTAASELEDEPLSTTEAEASNVASSVLRVEDQGASGSSVNYIIFGVLVVLLGGGLIFLRFR
jgi:hypothetical protein